MIIVVIAFINRTVAWLYTHQAPTPTACRKSKGRELKTNACRNLATCVCLMLRRMLSRWRKKLWKTHAMPHQRLQSSTLQPIHNNSRGGSASWPPVENQYQTKLHSNNSFLKHYTYSTSEKKEASWCCKNSAPKYGRWHWFVSIVPLRPLK